MNRKFVNIIAFLFVVLLILPAPLASAGKGSELKNRDKPQSEFYDTFIKKAELIWDGDAYIDLNEDVAWRFTITFTNLFNEPMTDVIITDRLAAELEIDNVVLVSQGTFEYYVKGNTKLTWLVSDLSPGENAELILEISTGRNKKWQEYTSPGRYELNSGATLKFIGADGHQKSMHTGVIDFSVPGEWPYDIVFIGSIPDMPVDMKIYEYPGSNNNYFDQELMGIPDGYDVSNGVYNGWCADSHVYITPSETYSIDLYSSYDPNLPEAVSDDEQWDIINYMLNHWQDTAPDATFTELQAAIWYFADEDPNELGFFTWRSQLIVDDALINGSGFVPSEGELLAVICDAGSSVQLTFIAVEL